MLVVTSHAERTPPVVRGTRVLENLLAAGAAAAARRISLRATPKAGRQRSVNSWPCTAPIRYARAATR
jgi:hypothetical protein